MADPVSGSSAERVRAALAALGHPDTIVEVPAKARTARGAAEAVGCTVAQIAKSIVFRTDGEEPGRAVLVITSGANRVDPAKAEAALGVSLRQADPDWVRQATGFAIGGVAPVGHPAPLRTLVDRDLAQYPEVWAAAGIPHAVYPTTFAELVAVTGGEPADVP